MAEGPPRTDAGLTIGQLARRFGLSRSALLHYDRVGLLRAEQRTGNGYRRYGPASVERLTRIVELRSAGMPLHAIADAMVGTEGLVALLEQQVTVLDQQIAALQAQRSIAHRLMSVPGPSRTALSRGDWTRMFRALGLSDQQMRQWHHMFELSAPLAHGRFLSFLGLKAEEIEQVRRWSADAELPVDRLHDERSGTGRPESTP